MVGWGRVDDRSMVGWGRGDDRGMVGWGRVDDRGMVGWGRVDDRSMVSRCGMNNRGMMDYRSMVCWSGMNSWCGSIAGNTFISDILDVSRVSISAVVDHLSPAVRKSHPVGARGGVSISLLLLGKVSSTVVITDSILESIQSRLSKVRGGRGGIALRSRGGGKGICEDENLHDFSIILS